MRPEISAKPIIAVLTGFLLSLAILFYFVYEKEPNQNDPAGSNSPSPVAITPVYSGEERMRSGLPLRLKIPEIGVDAVIEYVGLTADGEMDIPKNPTDVAWFSLGSRPGENGSAVISGHYGWKNDISSVFDDLHKLREGDEVYIEDENGATVTFVVRGARKYDPEADASEVFGSSDGKAHLNLVTCEGTWNEAEKSYSSRLAVFTDKKME